MKDLSQYPTPETESACFPEAITRHAVVPANVSQDLERRLAACRDQLACIQSTQIMDYEVHKAIRETLKATAPKP